MKIPTYEQLRRENEALRARLVEAEETLQAIRNGEVDALVVGGEKGDQIYTLQGAERSYRILLETMSEGAATVSRDGTILYCNNQFAALLKSTLETLMGSSVFDCLPPSEQPVLRALFDQQPNAGNRKEVRFRCTDGATVPVLLALNALELDTTQGFSLVATDLTQTKAAEEQLHQAQARLVEATQAERQRFLDMLHTLPVMVAIIRADHHIEWANHAHREALGATQGQICYGNQFGGTDPCEECQAFIPLETGKPHRWERTLPTGRTFDIHNFPFTAVDGSPAVLEMDIDITEIRRAQATLRDSNRHLELQVEQRTAQLRQSELAQRQQREFLECIIANAGSCIAVIKGRELRYTLVNPAFQAFVGSVPMVGRTYREVFPEAAAAGAEVLLQRVLETGEPWNVESYHAPVPTKPDAVWQGQIVRLPAGPDEAPSALVVIWDITERKRAENRLRRFYETDLYAVLYWKIDGEVVDVNDEFLRITGYTREDLRAGLINWSRITPPEFKDQDEDARRQVSETGVHLPYEKQYYRKDGTRVWGIFSAAAYEDDRTQGVSFILDITQRKQAEEQLQANAALLASVLEAQRQIAAASLDSAAFLRFILNCMSRLLNAEGASLEIAQADEMVYEAATGMAAEFVGFRLKAHGSLSGMCIATGQLMRADDIETDPRVDRQACRRVGLRSMILIPLRYDERSFGVLKVMSTRVAAFNDTAEHTLRMMGEFLGVTVARQRAQEALQTSEQRYRSLFTTMAEGLVLTEIIYDNEHEPSDLKTLEVNPSFERIVELNSVELIGNSLSKAFPDAGSNWLQKCGRVGLTGEPVRLEIHSKRLNRYFELFAYSYTPGKVACIAVDTTFRKTAEELLHSQAKHLEQLVQERTAKLQAAIGELEHFSYTLTHDMRAPLRAMRGYGEVLLLQAQRLPPTSVDFINRINTAAERMDHLIIDALDYSRLVRKDIPLQAMDIQDLLLGILETYPEFQTPNADVSIQGKLPVIMGNEAALTQCFSNLLYNAVKFVKPGQTPKIRVWAEDRAQAVRFWVEDNGIGIPDSCHQMIFVMFQRLNRDYEGTGIGLALVKKAAERMGGQVGVESEVGSGSRFWLEFRKPAASNPVQ